MGNKEHSSYRNYDYYSSSKKEDDDEEDENEYENENEADEIDENYINENTEYSSSNAEKLIKALNEMDYSPEEVKENFDFYKKNFGKLLKINKLVSNIKTANLYTQTPHDILIRLIPESDILDKNLGPEYGELERKTKELLNDYEVLPEYVLPSDWQELFKLQCNDTALDKLFIQSEIERITKEYADLIQSHPTNYKNVINQENYKEYEKSVNEMKKKKIEAGIKELKKLEYLNVTERQIRNNIKYYFDNYSYFFTINWIISYIKAKDKYDLTPSEFLKKYYPDYPRHEYPEEWKDLFKIADKTSKIDYLKDAIDYIERNDILEKENEKEEKVRIKEEAENGRLKDIKDNIVKKIKELKHIKIGSEKIKQKKDYYIENYDTFVKIDKIIDLVEEAGFSKKKPEEIYYKAYEETNCEVNKWEDLFKLKYNKEDIDKLFIATKIEYIKKRLSKYLESYSYYDSHININNYESYEDKYYKIEDQRKILNRIRANKNKVSNYSHFTLSDENKISDLNKEYEKAHLTAETDMKILEEFDEKYKVFKKELLRIEREREREEEEERERIRAEQRREQRERERANASNNNSRSNNTSSSSSNDMKKAYIKLCQNCKNLCIGCRSSQKKYSKGFGFHKKCQANNCYLCGKSAQERGTSYLCKSCYDSHKYDVAKCLSCRGGFK